MKNSKMTRGNESRLHLLLKNQVGTHLTGLLQMVVFYEMHNTDIIAFDLNNGLTLAYEIELSDKNVCQNIYRNFCLNGVDQQKTITKTQGMKRRVTHTMFLGIPERLLSKITVMTIDEFLNVEFSDQSQKMNTANSLNKTVPLIKINQ